MFAFLLAKTIYGNVIFSRCYTFDNKANLITDPDFISANNLDTSKYQGVTIGKKEGEVMKHLIYKHGFFTRKETIDFQGKCSISPYAPKVLNSIVTP